MKRIIHTSTATLTGFGLIFGVVAIGAPAALAKPTPYVTKAEWNQIRKGMPLWKVHRIFDTKGSNVGQANGNLYRIYPTGSKYGAAHVAYKKQDDTWKVTGKNAYWAAVSAATPTITQAEYNQIRKGMTMGQVRNSIGTTGTLKQSAAWPVKQENTYRGKFGRAGEVTIGYKMVDGTWKVAYKVNGWTYPWGA